jgi:hypothetical protein
MMDKISESNSSVYQTSMTDEISKGIGGFDDRV